MFIMKKSGVCLIILLVIPFVAAQYMYNPNIGQMQVCYEGDTRCDGNTFLACAKSSDACVKAANEWFSISDRMKAKYGCNQAYSACLDECEAEETKIPPEAMPSS